MTSDQLDAKIHALDQRLGGWLTRKDGTFWKEAWTLVREIGAGFKGIHYPSREAHQAAWDRFQELVSKMKADSEQHRQEREKQSDRSAEIKSKVLSLARRAWPRQSGFEQIALFISGVAMMEAIATVAVEAIMCAFGQGDKRNALQKWHDELKGFSHHMKEAWAYFEREKGHLMGRDKTECFKVLQGVSEELQRAWEEWKRENERHHGDRRLQQQERDREFEQKRSRKRELIRRAQGLDPDDRTAAERAKGLMSEWKGVGFAGRDHEDGLWADFQIALNAFWSCRKSGRRDRLTTALGSKEEHLQKLRGWIVRDEAKLDEFRGKRDSAWSDGYRDKMQSIIDDMESRLDQNRSKAAEVESAIDDIERTLRDLN